MIETRGLVVTPSRIRAIRADLEAQNMIHAILLGDSIFDNGTYVPDGSDVLSHVRRNLAGIGSTTLLARDGATVGDVADQLAELPVDATHLFISVGGNDALVAEPVLDEAVYSVAGALMRLAEIRQDFQAAYREMLDAALSFGLPVTVCTIYDPCFPDPGRQTLAVAALALFNDVIMREALARDLSLIDLRLLCDKPSDYTNLIEPSATGGGKIGKAVAGLARGCASSVMVGKTL